MGPSDASVLATNLTDRFGLPLSARYDHTSDGDVIELKPAEFYPIATFLIRVRFGWRSLSAEMIPGSFARDFVREMGLADEGGREGFAAIAHLVNADRGRIQVVVNGQQVDPEEPDTWPSYWDQVSITLNSPPIPPADSQTGLIRAAEHWAGRLLGMVLALAAVPEEPGGGVEPEVTGLPEGARVRIEVNRYERSLKNRAICIEVNGCHCAICGFDFGKVYGELGEGFVHVHHLTPVSRLTPGYVVSPVRDLIPVCANCHAMLHRRDPPLLPESLRACLTQGE